MKRLALIAVTAMLLAAACAGSADVQVAAPGTADAGQPTVAAEPTAAEASAADSEPTAEAEPVPADAPTAEPAEPASDSASSVDRLGSSDWCTASLALDDRFDQLGAIDFADPEATEQAYAEMLQIMNQAQQIAPPEIAGDVAVMRDDFATVASALAEVEWNFLDLDLAVIGGDEAELFAAADNIEAYNLEVCGMGDAPSTETSSDDEPSDDPGSDGDDIPVEGTIRDQAVLEFVEAGFSEEEAACLVDVLDFTDTAALTDGNALIAVFAECGISLDRLSELGG